MSTEADTPAAAPDTKAGPSKIYATLMRGRAYYLRDKEFLAGVAVEVTEEQKAWLETSAVDFVSVEGESDYQERPKFKFDVGAGAPVAAATPRRTRGRSAD
jgi:hypothetical protein